jgi:hypothetical protein
VRIRLTDEQSLLQASIRALGHKAGISLGTGAWADVTPDDAIDAAAPIGLGDILQTPVGAPWSGCVEAVVVASELARQLVPVPYLGSSVMAAPLAALAGSELAGARVATASDLTGWAASHDAADAIAWDSAGGTSVVALRRDSSGGLSLLQAPWSSVLPELDATDLTRRMRLVRLDEARPLAPVRGEQAREHIVRWRALILTGVAADLVGVMAGALAIAAAHARTRRQFGRAIGSFQAVAHPLAEHHVSVQAARIATYYAAWTVEHGSPAQALQAARVAKAFASEASRAATEAVVQVHGGIGFTWEHSAHLFLRRAAFDRGLLADERVHYRDYAAALCSTGPGATRPGATGPS